MAVDYFLKLDGIKGESTDSKHKDEIEIMSWSWGETQTGTVGGGGGGGAGKVQMQDFHFSALMSKASPVLFLKCANGSHIPKGTLTGTRAGKGEQEFLKFVLEDVLISSYQTAGAAASDALPTDSFSLNFAKIEFSYAVQKANGEIGAWVTEGWDLRANKEG